MESSIKQIEIKEPKSFKILDAPMLIEIKVGSTLIKKQIHLKDLFSTEEELVNELADINEIKRGNLWKKLKKYRIYGKPELSKNS